MIWTYVILLWHSLSLPYNYFTRVVMVQIWKDQCGSSRHGPANMKLVHTCLYKLILPPGSDLYFPKYGKYRSLPQLSGNEMSFLNLLFLFLNCQMTVYLGSPLLWGLGTNFPLVTAPGEGLTVWRFTSKLIRIRHGDCNNSRIC